MAQPGEQSRVLGMVAGAEVPRGHGHGRGAWGRPGHPEVQPPPVPSALCTLAFPSVSSLCPVALSQSVLVPPPLSPGSALQGTGGVRRAPAAHADMGTRRSSTGSWRVAEQGSTGTELLCVQGGEDTS